ncbi:MAG: ATP-binding protein [Candidatus Eremiobacteraeota bacterium]|nr:ATP-binding protein [Candidatus Eremiobacteraeota bacterium]
MGTNEWSLVTSDAREATRARIAIRQFLALQADEERSDLDAAELIVGELVANVIRHAPGAIGISVTWKGHEAVLAVSDRGPGVPLVRCAPDGHATSGRGLFLIQALAREVKIEAVRGHGSRVIVHLPVHRR